MSGIEIGREGSVLNVTFARPEKLNAVLAEGALQVVDALGDLHPDVTAVVFRGAGDRAFTTGIDVAAFGSFDPEGARAFIQIAGGLLGAVRTAEVVTISAIDGFCLGVGFELALACDLRLATPGSTFGLPEIKVGIPSVLDAALVQQYVGLSLAKEIILTGDVYALEDLQPFRVFNAVAERDGLEAEVERLLALTTRHSPVAIAAQKRLFEIWQNHPLAAGIDLSMGEFASVFEHDETLERLAAYRESMKRKEGR